EGERFDLHPALLDAVLHAALLEREDEVVEVRLPFAWSGVRLAALGAGSLRAVLRLEGDALAIRAYDEAGGAVAAVDSLGLRAIDPAALGATPSASGSLYEVEWQALELAAVAGPAPRLAVLGELPIELEAERHPDLGSLLAAIGAGTEAPELICVGIGNGGEDPVAAAYTRT